jgi:hypothetical protein
LSRSNLGLDTEATKRNITLPDLPGKARKC